MAGGIASTLLAAARPRGSIAGELGLFEVDELWLDSLAAELHPRAILLGNLFRDQLDRYGELETIADRWAAAVRTGPAREATLVLNADDPAIADLGRERDAPVAVLRRRGRLARAARDGARRRCEALPPLRGSVRVRRGLPRPPRPLPLPELRPDPSRAHGHRDAASPCRASHSARFTLQTPAGVAEVALSLPGLYNVYNALAAAALATALEVGLPEIVAGLQATKAAFGRAETVHVGGREMRILLVKNPAGANEVLRTLALEPGEHDLLGVLNDKIADGRDVSWIWDADFELLAGRIRRATCSGSRAPELALRLKYAGIDPARIHVQADLPSALREAAADGSDPQTPLYALPTYTAMLALRELLVARGEASSAWS